MKWRFIKRNLKAAILQKPILYTCSNCHKESTKEVIKSLWTPAGPCCPVCKDSGLGYFGDLMDQGFFEGFKKN